MSRWIVREWSLDDHDELYQLVRSSIPELSLWLPWCHANYSKQDTVGWLNHCQRVWEANIEYPMGVFDTNTGAPVGGVGINKIDHVTRTANLGYWTGTPWINRGVAKYAAREAIDFAFDKLQLETMEIVVHPENVASRRVAEALGTTFHGIVKERLMFRGALIDAVIYKVCRAS
jgi:RimJ/RimL family protein N-acetyltransferase